MSNQNNTSDVKVSVENFLKQYDRNKNNFNYSEYIVTNYVPVLQKKIVLTNLLKASIVEDTILPCIDAVSVEIHRLLGILLLYTNIDVETYIDNNSVYDLYDEFCKRNIEESVFCDKKEYQRILKIESDLIQNWTKYNQSLVSLIGKYKSQLGEYLENRIHDLNQNLSEALNNDTLQKVLNELQNQDTITHE